MWEIFYQTAFDQWVDREHPTGDLKGSIREWLAWLSEQERPDRLCVKVPGIADLYEARVPALREYVEFYWFADLRCIDVRYIGVS